MGWIKIQDERPGPGISVIVYMKGRGPLIGVLMYVGWTPVLKWWAIFSTGAHPIDDPSLITHWRYLPDPPEE